MSQKDLSEQVYDWAVKEMLFRPQGAFSTASLPEPTDYRSVCRGPMIDIWTWVVKHVHSQQQVKKVKGNLALHSQQQLHSEYKVKYGGDNTYSQEKMELQDERRKLLDSLTHTLSDSSHLEKDVSRLEHETQIMEDQYRGVEADLADHRRKAALLRCYSMKCQEDIRSNSTFTAKVSNKVSRLTIHDPGQSEQLFSKETGGSSVTETAISRDVRETCEHIGVFLKELLQGSFSQDKTVMERKKEVLWQNVEQVLHTHPKKLVLIAITSYALNTALSLRDTISSIDIKKDIENLRFKYECNEKLVDTSSETSALYNLDKLFEESQAQHIRKFFESEKNKNSAWRSSQQLTQIEDTVDHLLKQKLQVNPAALSLARKLFECEMKTVILRTAVRTLHSVAERLRDEITKASRERTEIYNKYQKIQTFKELADSKQNIIRVLVKQNVRSQSRLDEQQQEIQQYMMNTLNGRDIEVHASTCALSDSVKKEVESFAGLFLPDLMFAILESSHKIAIADLSINKLTGRAKVSTHTKTMLDVLKKIEFPLYKAPECILSKVLDLRNEIDEINAGMKTHSALVTSLSGKEHGKKAAVDFVTKLCEDVKNHDRQQLQQVLPVIQKRVSELTQAFTDLLQTKETVQMYWDQPAQYATPWVKVDDLTFQQWKDKWTVAVTRLRQLEASN